MRSTVLLAAALAAALSAAPAFSQAAPKAAPANPVKDQKQLKQAGAEELAALRREARDLALTDQDVKTIDKILEEKAGALARASGEIKVIQARLELLMLDAEPSMDEIKKLVRQSLDFEYEIRLIKLERSLAIRKIVGDRRWAILERLQRAYDLARRAGVLEDGGTGELGAPLLRLIGKL